MAAAVAALALAAPAQASHPPARGAVTHPLWDSVDPADSARELDLLVEAHATTVRIDMGWSTLEAAGQGQRDAGYIRRADTFFAQARARGLEVVVTLWTTPCWASSAPADLKQGCAGAWWTRGVDKYPPADPATYAAAASWVARRWGPDIAALEVWNEPNWHDYFRSDDPAVDYARLLQAAYPAVKRESPGTQVLGGSILMADRPFLEGLYAAGARGSFDALSMHAYGFNRGPYDPYDPYAAKYGPKYSYANGPPAMREAMVAAGDAGKGIWLTELGWSSCHPGTNFWCVTQDEQARYVADAFRMIHERWPWVGGAFVYNLRNKGPDPEGRESQMGLVHDDFTPKPSYASFAAALGDLDRPDPPAPEPPAARSRPAARRRRTRRRRPRPAVFADPDPGPLASSPSGPAPDAVAPALSRVAVTPRRIASRRAARRASVGWRLSESAAIDLRLERRLPGRMAGRRCVAASRAPRGARSCHRYARTGAKVTLRAARPGTGRSRLLPRAGSLRPGSYAVRAWATDPAGNRSPVAAARFTVARSARR